ncbi:MAG TPA: hypothetical protein VGZ22_15820 [Isosphaeraceae bacterium]|nr:hypothetical protein [Isosphaeraceae bacterium]
MICRDFERMWNAVLDAPDGAAPAIEQSLEAHAAACPACRAVAARYQTLRQALRAWSTPPAPAADFADRFVASTERLARPSTIRWTIPKGGLVRWSAAAALLLAGLLTLRLGLSGNGRPSLPVARSHSHSSRPLTAALADATLATWDLARSASEPAARVGTEVLGTEVLGAAAEPAGSPGLALPVAGASTSDVLHNLGDRINSGVRPISGSARHAFGFLLPTTLSGDKPTPRPHEGA